MSRWQLSFFFIRGICP